MKRRTFLNTAGTLGVVGLTASATLANSVYKDISSNQLLEEFDQPTKAAFENFVVNLGENIEDAGAHKYLTNAICMPTKIIEKSKQGVIYKNRTGKTVSIILKNGISRVTIV